MMPSISQLLIAAVVVVLLFGTGKIRNLGSDLGKSLRDFKKAVNEDGPGSENTEILERGTSPAAESAKE